jgi:hypothetical protein
MLEQTQAFSEFIHDRESKKATDPSVKLFDEEMAAYLVSLTQIAGRKRPFCAPFLTVHRRLLNMLRRRRSNGSDDVLHSIAVGLCVFVVVHQSEIKLQFLRWRTRVRAQAVMFAITPYFEKTVGFGGLCGFHRIGFSTASSTLAYRVCKFVVSVLKSPLDLNEAYEIVYHVLSSNNFLSRLLGGTVGPGELREGGSRVLRVRYCDCATSYRFTLFGEKITPRWCFYAFQFILGTQFLNPHERQTPRPNPNIDNSE